MTEKQGHREIFGSSRTQTDAQGCECGFRCAAASDMIRHIETGGVYEEDRGYD